MKGPAIVIGIIGLVVLASALVVRLAFIESPATKIEANVVDAGASDAGRQRADVGVVNLGVATPAPKPGPAAGPVVLDDGRSFSSVQAGIDAADAGTTVWLAPGEYLETVHIEGKDGLTLAGADAGVFLVGADTIPLEVRASPGVHLRNLALYRLPNPDPEISEDNVFGMTLNVIDSPRLTVERVVMKGARQGAELVRSPGSVLDEAVFLGGSQESLRLTDSSPVTLRGVRAAQTVVVVASPDHDARVEVERSVIGGSAAGSPAIDQIFGPGIPYRAPDAGMFIVKSSILSLPNPEALGRTQALVGTAPHEELVSDAVGPAQVAQIHAALQQGKAVLLVASRAMPEVEGLPVPPGTDFSWVPSDAEFRRVHDKLFRHPPRPASRREHEVVVVVGSSIPLCGPAPTYQSPGGPQLGELPSCEEMSKDIGSGPQMQQVVSVTDDWIEFEPAGWIHKDDVHAADEVQAGSVIIPCPFFHCEIKGVVEGRVDLAGDADACAGETCGTSEREPPTEPSPPEPPPHAPDSQAQIPLPPGMKLNSPAVKNNFSAACCT